MSAESWTFDLAHSSVQFHVRHLLVSKVHGRFLKWGGKLELDGDDLARSRIDVAIDAASIYTEEQKRDDHLRSPDFFDVAKYPQITFTSRSIDKKASDRYEVTGDLTIHGTTRTVILDVEGGERNKDPWGGLRTGFSAKTSISRKDFGLTWNVALETGGLLVGDKIEISLEIEAVKAAASQAA